MLAGTPLLQFLHAITYRVCQLTLWCPSLNVFGFQGGFLNISQTIFLCSILQYWVRFCQQLKSKSLLSYIIIVLFFVINMVLRFWEIHIGYCLSIRQELRGSYRSRGLGHVPTGKEGPVYMIYCKIISIRVSYFSLTEQYQ